MQENSNNSMKISLITTVKNEAKWAETLIGSILQQTRQPDEWIVVDGGSVDGTAEHFKKIPLCTVLEVSCNRAQGRNLAITRSSGDVLAVTDAGCLPRPTWLERLVGRLQLDGRRVAAGQTICRINHPFDAAQHALMDQFVCEHIPFRKPAPSCRSLAFHRQTWEECPFPEWLDTGEDSWMLIHWQENGWYTDFVQDAATEWIPQQSLFAFIRQYFSYIRGEGQAGIHRSRHFLRLTFYLGLLLIVSVGGFSTKAVCVAWSFWLTYLLLTGVRLIEAIQGRSLSFVCRAICWMLAALPVMDGAKTAGFLVGSLERLLMRKYTP